MPPEPCVAGLHLWLIYVAGGLEAFIITTASRDVKSAAVKAQTHITHIRRNDASRDRKPPAIVKIEYRGTIDA